MDVETIFANVAESRLLKKLRAIENLFFLGEAETIEYVRNFFQNSDRSDSYGYWGWSLQTNSFPSEEQLAHYQAVVIVFVKEEHFIFEKFNQYIAKLNIEIAVYKLFSDIFVNLQTRRQLLQKAEQQMISPHLAYAIVSTPRSG